MEQLKKYFKSTLTFFLLIWTDRLLFCLSLNAEISPITKLKITIFFIQFPYLFKLNIILTHLSYIANVKKNVIYQKNNSVLKVPGKPVAAILFYCKMKSVMALESVTSFLSLKDVTNTCKCMRHSPTIGRNSSVQMG